MEKEKNGKFGLGILVGILITLVLAMGAFIIYDKVLSNDNNKTPVEDNNENKQDEEKEDDHEDKTVTELSISDSVIVKELINTYWLDYYEKSQQYNGKLFYHEKEKTLSSDLNNKIKMFIVAKNIKSSNITPYSIENGGDSKIYYLTEFEKIYKKLFGKDTQFLYESTTSGDFRTCPGTELYNNNSDLVAILSACGSGTYGPSPDMIKTKIEKAEKNVKNDEIYIYELVAYPKYSDNHNEYSDYTLYKDRELANYVSEKVDDLSLIKDKINTYKYTFKSNGDGTYYFYSVEIVK